MKSLLRVESLKKYYSIRSGLTGHQHLHAVDDISLDLTQGETVGLVGESGSGKSTVGKCVTMLEPPSSGSVIYRDQHLEGLSYNQLRDVRKHIQMVFQDPADSLNPRRTVGETVLEPLLLHRTGSKQHAREQTAELFEHVGLKTEFLARYPHQLSGGQQQRVGIARALASNPSLIVLDEPTSALDVSVQAKLLSLLRALQRERGLTYLFVSHDLSVIGYLSHRVAVMYLGQIVEIGPTAEIFSRPRHPYTMALMSAIPAANPLERRERVLLTGEIPSPIAPPSVCRLVGRCPFVAETCRTTPFALETIGPNHQVACVRSLRGEIDLPTFDAIAGPVVTVADSNSGGVPDRAVRHPVPPPRSL